MSPYDFARRKVLEKRILAIVSSGLESSQMRSRIKILCNSAVKAFLNGLLQRQDLTLVIFKKTQSGTNHLTGIFVTPLSNLSLDEIVKM